MNGALVESVFTLVSAGSYPAEGALSKYAFSSFDNEPMYLTINKNVSSITPQDYSGEKFSQERSYYLSGLLEEYATSTSIHVYGMGFYVISGGEYLFLLDSNQPVYDRNELYANIRRILFYWYKRNSFKGN